MVKIDRVTTRGGDAGQTSLGDGTRLSKLYAQDVNHEQILKLLDPIIKRGSDIPCSFTKKYFPVADPADRVLISVYEGDVYDNPDSPENVKLAEIPWEFKPPRPQRDGEIEVCFEYGCVRAESGDAI